jgi:NAD(P)H-flavin reductase
MNEHEKNAIIEDIDRKKSIMSNTGTRPLVSTIKSVAQGIINESSSALIAIATPDQILVEEYFKGWKIADFDRLIVELNNL